jgi:hypothetical protein
MKQGSVITEVTIKEIQNKSSKPQEQLSQKLHECALVWSDKCAFCGVEFDELKRKLSSTNDAFEDNQNDLKKNDKRIFCDITRFVYLAFWKIDFIFHLYLDQETSLKEILANAWICVQDDVAIRLESLKEELEKLPTMRK